MRLERHIPHILYVSRFETKFFKLRKAKELTRLGTMFGALQFCYGEKLSGTEPGFRAIDLDEVFFQELEKILANKNAITERKELIELNEILRVEGLGPKQWLFISYINSHIEGPHNQDQMISNIQWLCDEIKNSVAKNSQLSFWMYKFDYPENQKERIKTNKEAIREFVGTRLANIFSTQNQEQEMSLIKGKNGIHILLACKWKNNLQEFTQFLYGGAEPDYNGILVQDKNAKIKFSKYVPGLAKNLIVGIAIGDRNGMGKGAQNKCIAADAFYGFDYGKPYEGQGVCSSLEDDFSFVDYYAKAPTIFRGLSKLGFARHFMYRNYSVFYDTALSERMFGFHLFRKMIQDWIYPNEDVIESYHGLRQELSHIQLHSSTYEDLLMQLHGISSKKEDQLQGLVNTLISQIHTNKLNFNMYFIEIKINVINEAIAIGMSFEETFSYIKFIDEIAEIANKSNDQILAAFEERMLLTSQEIDMIDKLEKYFSPASVLSHDGTVF